MLDNLAHRLATAKGECPTCGRKGKRHAGLIPDPCITCNGAGEVYLLEGLRVECHHSIEHGKYFFQQNCPYCHGSSFVASTDMGAWTRAALKLVDYMEVCSDDNEIEYFLFAYADKEGEPSRLRGYGHSNDPLTALLLALANVSEIAEALK